MPITRTLPPINDWSCQICNQHRAPATLRGTGFKPDTARTSRARRDRTGCFTSWPRLWLHDLFWPGDCKNSCHRAIKMKIAPRWKHADIMSAKDILLDVAEKLPPDAT